MRGIFLGSSNSLTSGAPRALATTVEFMGRGAKVATGVGAAIVVAGLIALALPAFAVIGQFSHGAETTATKPESTAAPITESSPSPSPSPSATPGACAGEASLRVEAQGDAPAAAKLTNADGMRDNGPRPGARGEVVWHGSEMYSYIVVPNDNLISIGERLCFDYDSLSFFNLVLGFAIQPGAQLILRPNPSIPFIHPYRPADAVAGTNTVEYNSAIYEIGAAVRTHDLDGARALWAKTLSGHVSPEAQVAATAALDAGDWPTLDQLFP